MIQLDGYKNYGAGETIKTAFRDAVQLARKTGQVVKLAWNASTYAVTYSDTTESLMRQFDRKHSKSKNAQVWKKRRRKQTIETNKKARRIAATLPNYLYAWALDSDRFYGKALSILMADDALQIVRQYETAEAIKDAFNDHTLRTVADSGASHGMTAQMAVAIAEGKFPGQDNIGTITHRYKKGKETFNLWKELNN